MAKTCPHCSAVRFDYDKYGGHGYVCTNRESPYYHKQVGAVHVCDFWNGDPVYDDDGLWLSRYYKDYLTDTILKHAGLINKLMNDRVIAILYSHDEDCYFLEEMCDEYFEHVLTRDECLELSEMFREMAEDKQ